MIVTPIIIFVLVAFSAICSLLHNIIITLNDSAEERKIMSDNEKGVFVRIIGFSIFYFLIYILLFIFISYLFNNN